MLIINGKTLADLAAKAARACKKKTIPNLILHGTFPIKESEAPLVQSFNDLALKWQATEVPNDLFFTHGKYINAYGNGKEFLIRELMRKKDSNRAVLSLINMGNIIHSGDEAIPSFMVLQCNFPETGHKKLFITVYFRALEVSQFLPINLAEISQIVRHLKLSFPELSEFELTIISCMAHYIPNFNCLSKTLLDTAKSVDIFKAVAEKDKARLLEWLDSKLIVEETVIYTEGLEYLYEVLQKYSDIYKKAVLTHLKSALNAMKQLKELRKTSSHSGEIKKLSSSFKKNLQELRKALSEE